jgi:hypothetical protein
MMTFLAPIVLFALPLAAIPILLHLYRRQQKNVMRWAAMQFLEDAVTQGRRWERLEEWILMALRALAVAALVFSVAQPLLRGSWLGGGAGRDVVLLIDDSLSTARSGGGEVAFDDIRRQAEAVLNDLDAADRIHLVAAANGPRWLAVESDAASADIALQKEQLRNLQPTDGSVNWLKCINSALAAELSRATESGSSGTRQVVVFSDRQAWGWQAENSGSWQQMRTLIEESSSPAAVSVVLCGPESAPEQNLAIVEQNASRLQVGPRETVEITVQVRNNGVQTSAATSVTFTVNGQDSASRDIKALEPGESTIVNWSWEASATGIFELNSALDSGDELIPDNTDSVIIEVVDEIPILIVAGPADGSDRIPETRYLTTALGHASGDKAEDWQSVYRPKIISVDDLSDISLSRYRAVVMTHVGSVSSDVVDQLRGFVESGGGLWLVLGRSTRREEFNDSWYSEGDGVSPLPLLQPVMRSADAPEQTIHPPGKDHPAVGTLADTRRLDIDTVRIRAHHRFDRFVANDDTSVLLSMSSGEPLVVEQYFGRGRVIVQAIPFGVEWSNLSLTKTWVVMVQDWLSYLTQPAATQFNLAAGGRIRWTLPDDASDESPTVVAPNNTEHPARVTNASTMVEFSPATLPGRYELRIGDGDTAITIPWYVSRDAGESELAPLTAEQTAALTAASGVQFGSGTGFRMPSLEGHAEKEPIWNSLLLALLAVLVVEGALTARATRRRSMGPTERASWEADVVPSPQSAVTSSSPVRR